MKNIKTRIFKKSNKSDLQQSINNYLTSKSEKEIFKVKMDCKFKLYKNSPMDTNKIWIGYIVHEK